MHLLLFALPLLLRQPRSGRIAPPAVLGDGGRGAGHAGRHGRRRCHRRGRRGGALGRRVGRRGATALGATAAAEGGVERVERGAEMVVLDAARRVRVLFLERNTKIQSTSPDQFSTDFLRQRSLGELSYYA